MPRLSTIDREFEALQATAEALLQQCPHLELMRFVRRMGLPVKRRQNKSGGIAVALAKQAKAAIAQLEEAGVIQLQPPTAIRESVLICRPGYQPRQSGRGYITPCTSRFDPTFKTWQPGDRPVRGRIDDIPIAVNWREKPSTPTEQTDMTRTKENYEKAIAAIQQAEQEAIANGTYKLPSRNQIGLSIDLPDYLYASTEGGRKAKPAYDAAQTRLTLQRSELEQEAEGRGQKVVDQQPTTNNQQPTIFPIPHPPLNLSPHPTPHTPHPTPDPYHQLRLEEDNARLRVEIEALRTQLEQTPKHRATPELVLLQALKDEDQKLRLDAAGLLDRITEMEQTRQQLLSNADVIQRLIEQRESAIEQAEAAIATVAATNGHKTLAGVTR